MTHCYLILTPHDPLILRDGRPFGFGARMKGIPWPTPSVVAGSLRQLLGKLDGNPWHTQRLSLQAIQSSAAFPIINNQLYLPAPADLYCSKNTDETLHATPLLLQSLQTGEGVLLPHQTQSLKKWQLLLTPDTDMEKPVAPPAWWAAHHITDWLLGKTISPASDTNIAKGFWNGMPEDIRNHVTITAEDGTATAGMLFQTIGRDFAAPQCTDYTIKIGVRVQTDTAHTYKNHLETLDTIHPLGGERRLAHWKSVAATEQKIQDIGWECPTELQTALKKVKNQDILRLYLASPADFGTHAWIPDWLNNDLTGTVPGTKVEVQLLAARVERWQAASGWDYTRKAPKAIRRLVPTGSVYYFRLLDGTADELVCRWLQPVQQIKDTQGFSLGIWGVYTAQNKE